MAMLGQVCAGCGGRGHPAYRCLTESQRITLRVVQLLIEAARCDLILEMSPSLPRSQSEELRREARAKRAEAEKWDRS